MVSETGTAIDRIIANVLEAEFEAVDQETLQNAKDRIIDTVGCLISGAQGAGSAELVELMQDHRDRLEATILMHGRKIAVADAAMVNCLLCRAFDYEPVSPVMDGRLVPGHVSGTTVMTAMSLSEAVGASGRELLIAMLLGDDLTTRLLHTCEVSLALGWDGNGTANAVGATATAGRLLGLNDKQLRHAFGLVLNTLSGTAQNIWEGTTAFKLPLGLAARNAIFSAQLAAAGWTAPKDALQGQFGYYELFTNGIRDEELLTKDLGKKFWGDRTFKPYSCCRSTHGLIDCALDLVNKHEGFDPEQIEQVTLHVPNTAWNAFLAQPWEIGEFPQGNALFSFRFTAATALLKGCVRPEHFTEEAIRDPKTSEFIGKMEVADLPAGKTGVALAVRTRDGRRYMAENQIPRGDMLDNPLSRDELVAKFWGNVEFAHRHKKSDVEQLLEQLENLEGLDNINEVVRLMVPDAGNDYA
jgi:2-methylcitrate dehydratase PrpD